MPRIPALLLIAALAAPPPASAQMVAGSNVSDVGAYADPWRVAQRPRWEEFQSTLGADRAKGGTFKVANPAVVGLHQSFAGMRVATTLRLPTASGPVLVEGWLIAGLDEFHPTKFAPASADIAYPKKGTYLDARAWNNDSRNPADWPLEVKDGWPKGLKPGQWSGYVPLDLGIARLPAGPYDFAATGTGKWTAVVRYRDASTPDANQEIAIVKGKASAPLVLASPECWQIQFILTASDPSDPTLPRSLLPRAAAALPASRLAPEALANERAAGWARFLDLLKTNDDPAKDWTAAAASLHGTLLARCSQSGSSPWLLVPRDASDAAVKAQATLVEAQLAPGKPWAQEYGNEAWNGSFAIHGLLRQYGAIEFSPLRKGTDPLVEAPEGVGGAILSARWEQDAANGSRLAFEVAPGHGIWSEDVVLVSGFADDALNGVARCDSDGEPGRFFLYYHLQSRDRPLPDSTGPFLPARGSTPRFVKLASWRADAPHVMNPSRAVALGQARKAANAYKVARSASPRVVPEVGGWSGSDDSALLDQFLLELGDAPPPVEPIGYATAPYVSPEGGPDLDRALVGDMVQIGKLTVSGAIATCAGPFLRPGQAPTATHGLQSGPATISNAPRADLSGPTTITAIDAATFTFPIKSQLSATPASEPSSYLGVQAIPGPPVAREILAVAREGDRLRLLSPAHGLAVGDPVILGGVDPVGLALDGPATVDTVQADSYTVLRPGYAPKESARGWAWPPAPLDRLMAATDAWIDGGFRRHVTLASRLAEDRGLRFDCYEFALAYGASPAWNRSPAYWLHVAATRDPRAKGQLARCYQALYAAGARRVMYYGDAHPANVFGAWAPEEYRGQGGPRRAAIDEARATYGATPGVRPRSTTAGRPVRIAIDAKDPKLAGGDGASLAGDLLDPGKSPGLLKILAGDAAIPFVVEPAVSLAFQATPPTVPAGKPRTFTLRGDNARWSDATRFTVAGGRETLAARVKGRRLAEIDLPALPEGPLAITDGEGGTGTITVRPAPRPGLVDGTDDPDFATVGTWSAWAQGFGGDKAYQPKGVPPGPAASWTTTVAASGKWRVSANWTGADVHTSKARYSLTVAGKPAVEVVVSQREAPKGGPTLDGWDFQTLFAFDAKKGDAVTLSLDGSGDGFVNADAAYFELVAPATDPDTKPDPPKPEPPAPAEVDTLKARVDALEAALAAIRAQIEAIGDVIRPGPPAKDK